MLAILYKLVSGTISFGETPYTVTANDGTSSSTQTFAWSVSTINLVSPGDQTNKEGDSVSLQMSATDALSKSLTYSAAALPSGLSINSSTGLISGTITVGDFSGGPYSATVTASDGTYSTTQTFTWNITQTNPTTPTVTNPGTQTNGASDSVLLPIQASDADGDALTYSATNLPDGLDIDPNSGIISGILAEDAPDPMPYDVTVTATDGNGLSASQTFTWIINAPALNVQVVPLNAVEGVDPGSITLATFTTADMNSLSGDFTADVDYGDGTTDGGVICGGNGSFTVADDHVYAEVGNYSVSITIYDSLTGASASEATTATVTDAPLTLTGGLEVSAIQQQSSTLTLATFTDGNSSAALSDFTATINWGDGSGNQAATVSDEGDGVFAVNGSHLYAGTGTDTATITVTDVDGSTATATSTVAVGQVYAGIPSSFLLSSFTDGNNSVPVTSFTATIDWGDGTPQVNGAVTGGNGSPYLVSGGHTYTQDSIDQSGGVYTVTVTVNDTSGNLQTTSSTVEVVRPPLSLTVANVNIASSLAVSNEQVAMFTEPDTSDNGGEFAAQIDWGDGNTSSGTIQEVTPGLFQVLGSHTYASENYYTMTVTVSQGWGGMAAYTREESLVAEPPAITFLLENRTDPPDQKHPLQVGKWQSAFTVTVGIKDGKRVQIATKKTNFITIAPEHFFVRVIDPQAWRKNVKTITVTIQSSSDTGHEITLKKAVGVGHYISAPLLLTTFSEDKKAGGDQTLNARLGNTVRAYYDPLGEETETTIPIQKVVRLHINDLRATNGGTPVIPVYEIKYDVAQVNKIYAAAGILFRIDGKINVENPPAGVVLENKANEAQNGLVCRFGQFGANQVVNVASQPTLKITAEERALLGARNLRVGGGGDIEVYYVNYLADPKGVDTKGWGESFPSKDLRATDAAFANSIIISANREPYLTLAHESGHLLLNTWKHQGRVYQLMYGTAVGSDATPNVDTGATDSRRITVTESQVMQKSPLASDP